MPGDFHAVLYSLLLIGFCAALALVISKTGAFGELSSEMARKAVHIGVCNWYFIWRYCFTSNLFAVLGLLSFAFINTFMTVNSKEKRWGLTYYPLSIILIILSVSRLGFGSYISAGVAILGMGYGDGLAAAAGSLCTHKKVFFLGRRMPYTKNKSAGGFLAFILSVSVICCLFGFHLHLCLLISVCGALCEAYTPFGLDNFTVPGVLFILSTIAEV